MRDPSAPPRIQGIQKMFLKDRKIDSTCLSPSRRRTVALCLPKAGALLCLLLLLLPACSIKKDYLQAEETDTVEGYQAFIDESPKRYKHQKKYVKKAEVRLEELTFEQVCEENTYAAFTEYLEKYPVGEFSLSAHRKGEELRAEELGIKLYRAVPRDYFEKVKSEYLPYRVLMLCSDQQGKLSDEIGMNWYRDLKTRDLFIPMSPEESYPVNPDFTIRLRQGVIYLCGRPKAFAEAEVQVNGKTVKTYRVAANRVEEFLLYEIFCDRELYDSLLGISEEERKAVSDRFERLRKELPKFGSVAFEVDLRQDAYNWDREMTLEWSLFLKELQPYETFTTYLRGQPPDSAYRQRVFLRVDREIHAPFVRTQWSTVGPLKRWNAWNTKWIITDQDYFFKKLTLDLVKFLQGDVEPLPDRKRPENKPIYFR